MRSARTVAITCGLTLWALLALAPLVGACLDGECALETGVRAAHCSMPATVMLCCDEAPDLPAEASLVSHERAVPVAFVGRRTANTFLERDAAPISIIAVTSHSPPLYELFASFLI